MSSATFRPTPGLYVQRALILTACCILVPALPAFSHRRCWAERRWLLSLSASRTSGTMLAVCGRSSATSLGGARCRAGAVALEWMVMGNFKPVIVPLVVSVCMAQRDGQWRL